jgi:hypothetical protein
MLLSEKPFTGDYPLLSGLSGVVVFDVLSR